MAKDKNRIELFELLAGKPAATTGEPRTPVPATRAQPGNLPGAMPARRSHAAYSEIVLGLDAAFVIFAGMLMLIASAYYLGYRKGLVEQALVPAGRTAAIAHQADVETAGGIEGRRPDVVPVITGGEYTLKLRSTRDHSRAELARLKMDARYIRKFVRENLKQRERMFVIIFDNSKIYSLGLGIFARKDNPRLAQLREILAKDPGPPTSGARPYSGCAIAKTGFLGKAVMP